MIIVVSNIAKGAMKRHILGFKARSQGKIDYLFQVSDERLRKINFIQKQVELMWTPEALSLFMINHPYLDSLNDVEIYNALKNYSRV